MDPKLLRTPLYECHLEAGGRVVPFAGYELPVQYTSIIAESAAVRNGAGMFDVSHMARLYLTGDRVIEYLEHITANDVSSLKDMQGHYSLLPNNEGGCVDDIIVYRENATTFHMVVNAANHEKDVAWLNQQNTFGVQIEDRTDDTAMIAVQGPKAVEIVSQLSGEADNISSMEFFDFARLMIAGVGCFAARSGYTGEDGFELVCKADGAVKVWKALLAAGVVPCGLGSRDVLRVEAGLPLYGHELSDTLSPIAAGLGWVISKTKSFIGSDIINAARTNGTPLKLQGIKLNGKRLPTPMSDVRVNGEVVGQVCSGIYSPLLGTGAAFAFISSDIKQGTACEVEMRGAWEPATVVNKRFFKRDK